MIPSTYKEDKSYKKQKSLSYMQKNDLALMMIMKNVIKSEIIVVILENIEELLIVFLI